MANERRKAREKGGYMYLIAEETWQLQQKE